MQEALEALLGPEAKGLSEATISRLKSRWEDERQAWSERDLSSKRYVCFWIDGVCFNCRHSALMGQKANGDSALIGRAL